MARRVAVATAAAAGWVLGVIVFAFKAPFLALLLCLVGIWFVSRIQESNDALNRADAWVDMRRHSAECTAPNCKGHSARTTRRVS